MWTKIYLIALTVGIIPLVFLTFYANSWLNSIGAPSDAAANFEYFSNISSNLLWISTLVLLILANILLWKTRKSWALWTTLGFFTVFILAKYFWLDVSFAAFKQLKGLPDEAIAGSAFAGVFYSLFFAIIIFFNQFIILRLSEKMHPLSDSPSNSEIESLSQPDSSQKTSDS